MADVTIRVATPADVPALFELILALADYEKLSHEVTGTVEALREDLFGDRPYIEAIVATVANLPPQEDAAIAEMGDRVVGFALFFSNYSTFLTKPGIYLEDLFVLPEYRHGGVGKALLRYLAGIACDRGCGRLEWSVLDWNEPAIQFYQRMGAKIMHEWRICRVTGEALANLAEG